MNPICFYHKADLDGACSGAIVKRFVPDCEMYGIDYGEKFPWVPAVYTVELEGLIAAIEAAEPAKRTVYMVDFSLPVEDMKRLDEMSNLIWIDHHKTALDACHAAGVNPQGLRETRWAACELTWAHMSGSHDVQAIEHVPEAVRLLGAYDSWRKDDLEWESKVLPFQYGMRGIQGIYDPECPVWADIRSYGLRTENLGAVDLDEIYGESGIQVLIDRGRAVLQYQAEANRKGCEVGAHHQTLIWDEGRWCVPVELEKYREGGVVEKAKKLQVLACNTSVFNSQFFDGFFDPAKHDVMCAYCQLANGKWKVSLYSTKPEIDCGAICKTFGGGGHKGAAGFVCENLPLGDKQ